MKEGWTYKKLEEICEKGTSNISLNKIEDNNGDYPLYGASGYVKSINFFQQSSPYIGVVKDGNGIGRVGIYPAMTSLVGTMQYLFPKGENEIGYLKYLLIGLHLEKFKTGAAIPHIYFKDYSKSIVPVPPVPEQQQIVSELDILCGAIEKQKAQIEEFDKLAQSIFYDMFGDPVSNEKRWKKCSLNSVTHRITDGVHKKPCYTDSGMPFISVVNINRGVLNFGECKFVSLSDGEKYNKRCRPEKNDILYTKVGATYGIPALVDVDTPFSLYVSVCLIKPIHEKINSVFLSKMMGLPYIKEQADRRIKGIGVPDLHLNQISAFEIILPPLSLQQEFAAKIEAIEAMKAKVRQSLKETEQLFNSRMDYYFN